MAGDLAQVPAGERTEIGAVPGITGSWNAHRPASRDALAEAGKRLAASLQPLLSAGSLQIDEAAGLCIAAVGEGAQTCWSVDGRYLVAGCGGVQALCSLLPKRGLDDALSAFDQGHAVAIWDSHRRQIVLARDRIGQSSLYYAMGAHGLVFSTELKTLLLELGAAADVDPASLAQLLRYGYIPAPFTICAGVFKLPAGACITLEPGDLHDGPSARAHHGPVRRYWDLKQCAEAEIDLRGAMSVRTAADLVAARLQEAVTRRHGTRTAVLFSGGVDSSLIAALLQRATGEPVDTLSVGFDDPRHDESEWAARVAEHMGARCARLMLGDAHAAELVAGLASVHCEPLADSSMVPMALAAREASGQWNRVLTGDGGDELFFGHSAYVKTLRNHALTRRVPGLLRAMAAGLTRRDRERARLGGMHAVLAEVQNASLQDSYHARVLRWRDPSTVLRDHADRPSAAFLLSPLLSGGCNADALLFLDQSTELPDGLLQRSGRAFGAFGVGVENPFLDPAMVSLSWRMPMACKHADGHTKQVLRVLLERHLPSEYVNRPKRGFGAPVARWLSGPLRDWADDLLDPVRLRERGLLDEARVTGMWKAFLQGQRKFHTHLWPILMFQAWDRHWNPRGRMSAMAARMGG